MRRGRDPSPEVLIGKQPVTRESRGEDDYGWALAVCNAGGQALNPQLIREASAWACVRDSDTCASVEREAPQANRGVFADTNTPP